MADEKKNDQPQPQGIILTPPITGDFDKWTKDQLTIYFLSLNDPQRPLYAKDELEPLEIKQLKAWATKAYQIWHAYQLQGKVPPNQTWIPAKEGKIPMPVGPEIDYLLQQRAQLSRMHELLAKDEHDQKQDQLNHQQVRFADGGEVDINVNLANDNGAQAADQQQGNPEQQRQQQRQQGVKRPFEQAFAPMPDDEKYVAVELEEAARFFNGGFAAVKADVEALMGVDFFKLKDGNGQVFYMRKDKNGKERIQRLHQRRRPTGYDSDDDVDDHGFQDQMNRDPFFRGSRRHFGVPPKKKPKVSIGHMVRI